MSTVGQFVKSKMHNMAVWVRDELGPSMDYVATIDARTELELTTLCTMLNSKKDIAARRDWDALLALVQAQIVFTPMVTLLQSVREKEHMQEKFWKYVQLFVDVVE